LWFIEIFREGVVNFFYSIFGWGIKFFNRGAKLNTISRLDVVREIFWVLEVNISYL
jgi:hypothetical protein